MKLTHGLLIDRPNPERLLNSNFCLLVNVDSFSISSLFLLVLTHGVVTKKKYIPALVCLAFSTCPKFSFPMSFPLASVANKMFHQEF